MWLPEASGQEAAADPVPLQGQVPPIQGPPLADYVCAATGGRLSARLDARAARLHARQERHGRPG